jgi:hypothetical protein
MGTGRGTLPLNVRRTRVRRFRCEAKGFSADERIIPVLPETRGMTDCRYCGCTVEAHDPVYVAEGDPDANSEPFCNYGCLSACIEREDLTTGTSCNWSPEPESVDSAD